MLLTKKNPKRKHKTVEANVKGVKYIKGVNVGYDISVGGFIVPNVGHRSVRDVKRQLVVNKLFKPEDIKVKRVVNT
jgi:hypothetical protein